MTLRPFQFTIRQLTAFFLSDSLKSGFGLLLAFVFVTFIMSARADWRVGLLGRVVAGCIVIVGFSVAVFVCSQHFSVSDDAVVNWLVQWAFGTIWGALVGTAVYLTLKLMKQPIDATPLRDDSCGAIGWHLFDDKGCAVTQLE